MGNEDLKKKRNNRFISLIEFIRVIKYIHYLINTKIYMYIYVHILLDGRSTFKISSHY